MEKDCCGVVAAALSSGVFAAPDKATQAHIAKLEQRVVWLEDRITNIAENLPQVEKRINKDVLYAMTEALIQNTTEDFNTVLKKTNGRSLIETATVEYGMCVDSFFNDKKEEFPLQKIFEEGSCYTKFKDSIHKLAN